MSNNVQERVSLVLKKAPFSVKEMSERVGVSNKTIYRWQDKEVKNFKPALLKNLAEALEIEYEWLAFGTGPKVDNSQLNQISTTVNEKAESYKGLDQTLSDVESKANSLIQDLKSLVDDLEKIRSHE